MNSAWSFGRSAASEVANLGTRCGILDERGDGFAFVRGIRRDVNQATHFGTPEDPPDRRYVVRERGRKHNGRLGRRPLVQVKTATQSHAYSDGAMKFQSFAKGDSVDSAWPYASMRVPAWSDSANCTLLDGKLMLGSARSTLSCSYGARAVAT